VIVPALPGAFSAWGMLHTDIRHDFKTTFYGFWDQVSPLALASEFEKLEGEGRAYLIDEGVGAQAVRFERFGDFRYQGQEYVLTIPISSGAVDMAGVRRSFDAAYERQYGHSSPEGRAEVANLRVAAIGRLQRPPAPDPVIVASQPRRMRDVYFDGLSTETAIIQRDQIAPADVIYGPAVIEEPTATTLLPPNWRVRLIAGGHLSLTRMAAET
jgi:N-methylhydantoinase A